VVELPRPAGPAECQQTPSLGLRIGGAETGFQKEVGRFRFLGAVVLAFEHSPQFSGYRDPVTK
jgi:hypothetical protein